MSRQQWDLVYPLGEEVPKLVYAFLICKPVIWPVQRTAFNFSLSVIVSIFALFLFMISTQHRVFCLQSEPYYSRVMEALCVEILKEGNIEIKKLSENLKAMHCTGLNILRTPDTQD